MCVWETIIWGVTLSHQTLLFTIIFCIGVFFKWNKLYKADMLTNKLAGPGFTRKPTSLFFWTSKFSPLLANAYPPPLPNIILKLSNQCNQSRPVQSLCPTNIAKMIGLDCHSPTEILYPPKKKKKSLPLNTAWIFIPLTEASFPKKSNDISKIQSNCFLSQS